jgi:lipopolysaccharide/colanic/teichoic acid biosynthesis glycosyltransferase
MIKRCFDLFFSILGIILLLPVFLFVTVWICIDSWGTVFYRQQRVGRNGIDFTLYKFRTMKVGADKNGLLTVGGRDPRITRSGYLLRKYKLDELPQLFNVLIGDMSLVGPRPEVRRYVNYYTTDQKMVLNVKPGITDYASIEYSEENELLAKAADPEKYYIEEVMPAKLLLNRKYIDEQDMATDMRIIWRTLKKIWS